MNRRQLLSGIAACTLAPALPGVAHEFTWQTRGIACPFVGDPVALFEARLFGGVEKLAEAIHRNVMEHGTGGQGLWALADQSKSLGVSDG